MARFIVRRLISMIFVLFAVSVLTFAIFNVIPNGDPAVRMAGKNATETQIEAIRKDWGFDEPIYTQYGVDDGEDLHRRSDLLLHPAERRQEIWKGLAANPCPRVLARA